MIERTRLPNGIRSLSDEGLALIVSSLAHFRHRRMCRAMHGILAAEIDRRDKPSECEGPWPIIDTTDWNVAELHYGMLDTLVMLSVLERRDARDFARDIGVCLFWALQQRQGHGNPPAVDVYAPGDEQ